MIKTPAFFIPLFILYATLSFSQDKIVFKDKPDTVFCKITKVTPTNIFYIEKKEYKSDYMRNVVYHLEAKNASSTATNKKEDTQNKEVKTKKETTTKNSAPANKEVATKKEPPVKNEVTTNKEDATDKEITVKNAANSQTSSDVITIKQNTIQVLFVVKFREKHPTTPEGYNLHTVYTLPATGFIPLIAIEPTFFVYKKK